MFRLQRARRDGGAGHRGALVQADRGHHHVVVALGVVEQQSQHVARVEPGRLVREQVLGERDGRAVQREAADVDLIDGRARIDDQIQRGRVVGLAAARDGDERRQREERRTPLPNPLPASRGEGT